MIRLRDYRRNDAYLIELTENFQPEIFLRPHVEEKALQPNSKAWTFFDPATELPIAICGITNWHPGMAECWTLLSPDFAKNFMLVRFIRRGIDRLQKENNWRRLQATIKAGDASLIKWIEFFGFKHEGLMEKYGPDGCDYMMYGRIR